MQYQYRSVIYAKGKTTIPNEIRKILSVHDGENVVYMVDDKGQVILENEDKLVMQLKQLVQTASHGKSLVNELISDRRKEAKNE